MIYEKLAQRFGHLGVKINSDTAPRYNKLSELIPEEEELLYAFDGLVGKEFAAVTVTPKCVYIVHHAGLLGMTTASIPVSKITSVTAVAGKMMGLLKSVVIAESGLVHTIGNVAAPAADQVIAAINHAQTMATAPTQASAPVSQADELLKFKQLLDAGVLTQEEFDKKKAQILNS